MCGAECVPAPALIARGGFIFDPVHKVQPKTPVENLVAMFEALREFAD